MCSAPRSSLLLLAGALALGGCASGQLAEDARAPQANIEARGQPAPTGLASRTMANDDNLDLRAYRALLARYRGGPVLGIDISRRLLVRLEDAEGRPSPGVPIELQQDGRRLAIARSHADGRAVFFPTAADPERPLLLIAGGQRRTLPPGRPADHRLELRPVASPARPLVELVICLDTTGSMGDELERLQRHFGALSARLQQLAPRASLRWGLVAYRDEDEAYRTRGWLLTDRPAAFTRQLRKLDAAGGGDYREALGDGLWHAVRRMDWSERASARLIVLIGDAPPHLDRQDTPPYPTLVREARRLGIKLLVCMASGLDEAGRYTYRQLAQQTLGRWGASESADLDALIYELVAPELRAVAARSASLEPPGTEATRTPADRLRPRQRD